MKKACHILVLVGFILDIIAVVGCAIGAVVMFITGAAAVANAAEVAAQSNVTEEEAAAVGAAMIAYGVVCIVFAVVYLVGAILAKKGLKKTDANQESIGFGVALILFSFIPAGILYIICAATNKNNATVIEG